MPASRQVRLDDTMRESIESLFAASLGDSERAAFYGYSDDDLLFCLMDAETIASSDFKQIARELLYSLNLHCGDKLSFAIGIGRESSPSVPLHEACLSALAAVQSQFYFGAGLVFSEPPPTVRFDASSAAANVCPDFHQALRDENEAEIEALIDRLTLEARTLRDPETDRVRNAYFRLLMILHEFAMEKKLTVIDPSQEESFIWQEVGELCTLDSLRDYVVGNVQAVFSQYKESTAVNARVGGVMHYIKIHYADKELTTKSIADNTYLSQSYMCALFKKETGKTVNEYMTEVRLEKAKELLKERHVKLYEIASAIGITDPNYFSSMFKKATGLTPSQYRERM
ncbi:helix-turn-helix transcriptional regulator [Cohnella boryungensis]|uniref:Helix-turn-helix transcriptional regulator n=1 Tax=Cohnella boryungensis TaxID=768479 RepID=A0ABV8S9Y5_9BACL